MRSAAAAEAELRALLESTERRLEGDSAAWEEALLPSSAQKAKAKREGATEGDDEEALERQMRAAAGLQAQVQRLRESMVKAQLTGMVGSGAVDCNVQ